MDMTGEYTIPAPRARVWAALNDPEVLRAAIPGCEELTQVAPNELTAKVTAKIGPVKQKFTGDVFLEDVEPPHSYRLRGEGKGTAGFAKGGARVALEEVGEATILRYEAHADIGGKLAQLGSRLVQGSAKKMADDFFGNLAKHVTAAEGAPAQASTPASDVDVEPVSVPAAATPPPLASPHPAPPPASPHPAPPHAAAPVAGDPSAERAHEPSPTAGVPRRAAAAAEAAARVTAERAAGLGTGAGGKPFWQRPIIWAAVVALLVLLIISS